MPTYIKTGFWDKIIGNNPQQAKAPKEWLNLELLISKSRGYKVYTALLTQENSDAPTAVVLTDDFNGDFTYLYSSAGRYTINSASSLFDPNKTFVLVGNTSAINPGELINFAVTSNITLWSLDNTGAQANGVLLNTPIEIRIYP